MNKTKIKYKVGDKLLMPKDGFFNKNPWKPLTGFWTIKVSEVGDEGYSFRHENGRLAGYCNFADAHERYKPVTPGKNGK